jgi:hypothetical protein
MADDAVVDEVVVVPGFVLVAGGVLVVVVVVGVRTRSGRRSGDGGGARDVRRRLFTDSADMDFQVPVHRPVPDVAVGVGQLDRRPGHLDRIAVDGGVEVLLGVPGGQVDAAVGDIGVALRPELAGLAWMNSPLLEIRTAHRSCTLL